MRRVFFAMAAAMMLPAAAHAQAPAPDPRPTFHYAPQRNWMNDPNGLVYYDGEYHLFYQYNPHGDRWGHMSWGHAVSRDMVRWTELPLAIPETDVMAFSGSAVIDWHNTSGFGRDGRPAMVALYTGYDPVTQNQSQYLAYSNDRGRTFSPGRKVLDIGSTEFRDPKVFWHDPTQRWVMVTVKAVENRVAIFTSPDLKAWTHASDFGPVGARAKNWECPDLFELPVEGTGERRWVLSLSQGDRAIGGGSGGQWFVGAFDGTRFTPAEDAPKATQWMDRGADFYAAVSWDGVPGGRRIWIGWANDWRYANAIPTWPARGLMSVPRVLTLSRGADGYRLHQAPVAELARYRTDRSRTTDLTLGETPVALPRLGESIDMDVEIETGSADRVTLTLTDAQGYETAIGVVPAAREMYVDRTRSGPHVHDAFPDRHTAPIALSEGKVRLRILADRSIVEVFADDGAHFITDRFFRGGGALRWSATARGGRATIRTLEAWRIAVPVG